LLQGPLPTRYAELRDWFLPSSLRGSDAKKPSTRAALYRARRFISLLLVITLASAVTLVIQLAQGIWLSGAGAAMAVLFMLLSLGLIRRGVSLVAVGLCFLGAGALLGVALALVAGVHGMSALFWVTLAPTLALSITGIRLARWVLAITALLEAAAVWLMYNQVLPPLVDVSHQPGGHIGSLLGAMCTYFALTWAYERETAGNIAELECNNAELIEARRAAEAASRAKGEFLAAMSHEIRTPLNGVLGMTSVMLSGDLPGQVREGLGTIQQSGSTLLALLNDVLDFSRIESAQFTVERVPVDIAAEVRGVAALLGGFARERGNQLAVRVDEATPRFLLGDPLRLRQITLNLASNAIKFTENGSVQIAVRVEGPSLTLEVSDTGIGIAPATLTTLFQPFTQADASTTRRFGGTGLGLAIVAQLVEAMHGQISVDSRPGQGSRFSVRLPAVACEAPAPDARPQATPTAGLRILLAEDNPINSKVARLLLKSLGHQVTAVENGEQAVAAVSAGPFDLVLMDCHMPVMDGFEATRLIRLRDGAPPVVALTAAAVPEEQQRCLDVGMMGVLLKPIDRQKLGEMLARIAASLPSSRGQPPGER